MKIIKLQAENIKKLRAVEITPTDDVVILSGKNEAGKSSVLDSICMALGAKMPSMPIREGETKAKIKLDIGEYVVTKTITRKDGGGYSVSLKIEDENGAKIDKAPQTLLNGLLGELAFDPLEFKNMKPAEQLDMLKRLSGLDFTELDNQRREAYEERTVVGRTVKKMEGQISGFDIPADVPDEEIDIAELSKEKDSIQERIELVLKTIDNLGESMSDVSDIEREIQQLEATLKARREQLDDAIKLKSEWMKKSEEIQSKGREPELQKIKAEITEKINTASKINQAVRDKKNFESVCIDLSGARKEVDDLTEKIENIDRKKADTIKAADMPIDGLSLGLDGILYNGIPFDQLSGAQSLRVSTAMAMAMNPTL